SAAFAYITLNVDFWQEQHLDLHNTLTTTWLTASACNVETESPFIVPSCLCFWYHCKKFSDIIKLLRVCCRITTWCSSYRRLVYCYDLIYLLYSFYFIVLPYFMFGSVELIRKSRIKRIKN